MQYGLILSDPMRDSALRGALTALLDMQLIPHSCFTQADTPRFSGHSAQEKFLRTAAQALLRPGEAIPAALALRCLSGHDARCGNVLRRYVCMQLSLLPTIAADPTITEGDGCHRIGQKLLVAHLGEDGRIDAALPGGVWTDIISGECFSGARLRLMRSLNAMPVLAAPNSVIAVGVNDRTPDYDYADRVTLHWFEPDGSAEATLPDGTRYTLHEAADGIRCETNTALPYHIITHRDGCEALIR